MATITVKNIPNDLYEKLKVAASFNHQSINNEVIYCIENMIRSRKVEPETFIGELESFYKDVKVPPLTNEKLKEYKESGRL